MNRSTPWIVMKFGGTSVGNAENWPTILQTLKAGHEEGARPLLVCSALSGVSNLLEDLLQAADAREPLDPYLEKFRVLHKQFADDMGLDADDIIDSYCQKLSDRLHLERIHHLPAVPPDIRAQVMSVGELLSTQLGASWLRKQGLPVRWLDAREALKAEPAPDGASDQHRYLSATCSAEHDQPLCNELEQTSEKGVVITQGFIASNDRGQTVLLGRGGSDTAAAYFAAKLGAKRLDIWTDVPGMFTANPQEIPQARLIQELSYDEAETLAGMGAKVLHPPCIQPLREAGIPLHIRWTENPNVQGTVISPRLTQRAEGIKAVSARDHLCLISMERRDGWQPVGFMADVANCFKQHALSIDLLSSSPWKIQTTVDLTAASGVDEKVPVLLRDLENVCQPKLDREVASVSLVGHGMRGCMHRWAPLLERLRERKLLMVTQTGNDLTFSFVVPQDQADMLLKTLHEELFEQESLGYPFGLTWEQLLEKRAETVVKPIVQQTVLQA